MWTRAELKEYGKINFKRYYWVTVAVCFVTNLMYVLMSGNPTSGSTYDDLFYSNVLLESQEDIASFIFYDSMGIPTFISETLPTITPLIILVTIVAVTLFAFIIEILLYNPIFVGKNYYFMGIRHSKRRFKDIFLIFNRNYYPKANVTMFFKSLYIFLWSLLLIIPGVIKMYEYFMIPYILAENPTIDRKRAFELSHEMMVGQKWNTFVLQLSFIGWDLLTIITFGLAGIFYVIPYREATHAELYATLRQHVLDHQFATPEELPGFNH